jgi:hypothetical protein
VGHISAFSFYATKHITGGKGGAYPLVFFGGLYQQPFQHYKHLTAVFCSTPSPLPTVFLNHSSTAAFIWVMVSMYFSIMTFI